MKRYQFILFLLLSFLAQPISIFATQPNPQALGAQNQSAQTKFWENKGQIKDHNQQTAHFVKFGYEKGNTQVFLLETGLVYQFSKLHYPEGYQHLDKFDKEVGERSRTAEANDKLRLETYRMDMQLVGANPNPRISREGKSTDYINYYNHNVLGVHGYEKIIYHEIYQGIDWVVYTNKEGLKYDFVVRPNADIRKIRMRFEHQEDLRLNPDGSFTLSNPMGTITEQAPVSFQNGKKIATRFVLNGNELSFSIANYDPSQTLTIDPNVLWATYYGGTVTELGNSCAVDASGNVYLAGYTNSTNAIASGGHQNTRNGNEDAFLVKFNSNGIRQWATYYGGTVTEFGNSCAVDASGNVYLAGETNSTNDIASGGHQNTYNGGGNDAFLVKFNSNGVRQWATYYGGVFGDSAGACTIDASGNVYLAGATQSGSSIASGGHQNTYGGGNNDAFLVKFNSNGVRQWATYYGGANAGIGNGDDAANSCAVDANGNVYLAGNTSSSNAAVIASGGYQNTYGGSNDAFLVKFNPNGTRLWATYYGAAFQSEYGNSCIIDANGNVYLAGYASSSNVITYNGHQNNHGGGTYDAFLVKFNSAGTRLWATYYGGTGEDYSNACAVDASGNVYLAGYTNSTNDIASGGHQNAFGGVQDAFLVKFNGSGVRQWGTYYGGTGSDYGYSCATDANNNVYLAGNTSSASAIASGGHQNTLGGGTSDAFLVKFNDPCVSSTGSVSQTICSNQSFLFNGLNRNTSGAYLDTLIAANGCDSFLTLNLTVLPTRTGSFSQTICAGQTFLFNGVNRNTSGAYLDTLIAANGCDSFLTLNLTVTPTRTGSISQTICSNQSFLFNGINRNVSGAYLDTLVASNGCDSFLTLNLTVLPTRTGSISQTICSNQSFFFNGLNRNTSGAYLDTLVAANGCDSFLTLNLTVLPTRTGSFSQSICAGQSFLFNGFNRNTSGAYLDTLIAANGCDSFLTLNLTVISIDTFVSQQGNTLTARQTGATYQWVQCPATPILGANSATFTPTATGNYAVSVTSNGCSALSGCRSITVTPTSVENIDNQININIYPNPNTGEFFVAHGLDFAHIRVSDLLGRTIHTQISQQENMTIITIPQAAAGVYIVSVWDKKSCTSGSIQNFGTALNNKRTIFLSFR